MFSKRVLRHVSCLENERQDTTCVAKPIGTIFVNIKA